MPTRTPPAPSPGLCERCDHARRIVSGKGSVFWRCAVADREPNWPKYPPLPVRACKHHQPGAPSSA